MARECTDELVQAICAHIQCGASLSVAAQAEGIGKTTLYRWKDEGIAAEEKRDRGEELDGKEEARLKFRESVARSVAQFETSILADLRHGEDSRKDRAREWLLERIRREQYGVRIEVVARDQAAEHLMRILREKLTDAELAPVLAALHTEDD